jgi:hypothetical protein
MCATDIARYYPSIGLDRLETRLHDLGCDLHGISVLLSALRKWASADGICGLPIGPEASAILGNAFLIPVDRMLISAGIQYVRWMDDYKLMCSNEAALRSIEESFDQFVFTQGLKRSIEKTECYPTALAAIASLRDSKLASLGHWLNSGADWATDALHTAFERDIAAEGKLSQTRFRFILRTLRNRLDDFGAVALADNPRLANIDPRVSGEYLATVGLRTSSVVTAMFAQLSAEPSDETDALNLHLLRALAQRSGEWGTEEGAVFESIAESDSRRPPVRAWAVHAFSRTSRWRQASLMESAEAEPDPLVRRIKVTTLAKVGAGTRRRQFLSHMRAEHPELAPTIHWLNAA